MRNLAFRLSWTTQPTREELGKYLAMHGENYRQPARRSFSHIFFSREQRADNAEQDAREAMGVIIKQGGAEELGDRFMLPSYFSTLTQNDIRNNFGAEFASAIFELKLGEWLGPIPSPYGVHLVYVHEEVPAQAPTPRDIEDQVRLDLNKERHMESSERLLPELPRKVRCGLRSGGRARLRTGDRRTRGILLPGRGR